MAPTFVSQPHTQEGYIKHRGGHWVDPRGGVWRNTGVEGECEVQRPTFRSEAEMEPLKILVLVSAVAAAVVQSPPDDHSI